MDHDEASPPWQRVLDYWFGDVPRADGGPTDGGDDSAPKRFWFQQNDAIDAEVRRLFADDLIRGCAGELDSWAGSPHGRLALVIVLDQLSRNIHRDSGEAYASDARAQELCLEGVRRGDDEELSLRERWFFYMPLMHAEDLALQDRGIELFERLAADAPARYRQIHDDVVDYARRHRAVIARFGRFPHRNEELGRTSTEAENEHLARGERF